MLWQEYEHVLFQEEILWYQKSRTKWLQFGDRNTKFFHGTTIVRRRRNTYEILQDSEGNWVGDQDQLEAMVTSYFSTLFTEVGNTDPACISSAFPKLTDEECRLLDRDASTSEIFNTINHMGALKAPSPYGLQSAFFQSQWQVVGDSICNLVKGIFREHNQISQVNQTFITLIPKVEQVSNIKDFRPISLCNVSYKIVTKILAQRLRLVMGKLVNPCQSSFIPNRQSRDNIIIAQEIFHSMRKKRGKKGWMAIKLDLEKAYDRLSWKCIKETMEDIGLPQRFIQIVMHCISTSTMSVLWNGEALEEFKPTRGIRQGDPFSPYLFVLYIEKLFQMIEVAVNHNHWKPIQLVRGGPRISHLAFGDDVLLFAEASEGQVTLMRHVLGVFCRFTGQKISEAKTRIFFSKNVDQHVKRRICEVAGFQMTEDLGNYLGVPIIHKRVNSSFFCFILDKVD